MVLQRESASIVRFSPRHNLCFVASSAGGIYTFDLNDNEKRVCVLIRQTTVTRDAIADLLL